MMGPKGDVTMPLHDPADSGWVANISAALEDGKKPPHFDLYIQDTSRLESVSSEQRPLGLRPITVLTVTLPLNLDSEIPVYKSPNLAVSIRFDSLDK